MTRCHREAWCSDQTLKAAFLVLLSIARLKEALLADHFKQHIIVEYNFY